MTGKVVLLAVLSAMALSAVIWFWAGPPARRTTSIESPPPIGSGRTARVRVLFGADDARDALVRRRYPDETRAAFSDRATLSVLRGVPGPETIEAPALVEVWVVNRAEAEIATGAAPPTFELADGRRVAGRPLREFAVDPPSAEAALLLAAFGDGGPPLGNGKLRRVVFALPLGVAWTDVLRATVDGIDLAPAAAAVDALEAFSGEVRPALKDLIGPVESRPVVRAHELRSELPR